MLLALMAFSVMLGIRIERFQQSGEITAHVIQPSVPARPGPDVPTAPQETPPVAPAESPAEEAAAVEPAEPEAVVPSEPAKAAVPVPQPKPAPAQSPVVEKKEVVQKPTPAPAPKPETAKPPVAEKPKPQPVEQKPAPVETKPSVKFAVQVSSSQDKALATSQIDILKGKGFPAYPEEVEVSGKRFYRVMVGPYPSEEAANAVRGQIIKDSRFASSYVRHVQ